MSIEFPCPGCGYLLRTPDGTEGRPARCGQCRHIVIVPGRNEPEVAAAELAPAAPHPLGQFAAPTPPRAEGSGGAHPLRIVAGIGLVGYGCACLVWSMLMMAVLATFVVEGREPLEFFALSAYTLFGLVVTGLSLGGGISFLRARGVKMATAGTVMSFLPCSYCCLLGLPVGILCVIALNSPDVLAEFRRNR